MQWYNNHRPKTVEIRQNATGTHHQQQQQKNYVKTEQSHKIYLLFWTANNEQDSVELIMVSWWTHIG